MSGAGAALPPHLQAISSHLACISGSCCRSTPSRRPITAWRAAAGVVQVRHRHGCTVGGHGQSTEEAGPCCNLSADIGCHPFQAQDCSYASPLHPAHLQLRGSGCCTAVQVPPLLRLLLQPRVQGIHSCSVAGWSGGVGVRSRKWHRIMSGNR